MNCKFNYSFFWTNSLQQRFHRHFFKSYGKNQFTVVRILSVICVILYTVIVLSRIFKIYSETNVSEELNATDQFITLIMDSDHLKRRSVRARLHPRRNHLQILRHENIRCYFSYGNFCILQNKII